MMNFSGQNRQHRYINPGAFFFGGANYKIHTILGSCIAITLWHPFLRIGGMCHFILAGGKTSNNANYSNTKPNGRYCNEAIALFENEIAKCGTSLKDYQVKIFGGGNMLLNTRRKNNQLIGTKNINAAIQQLSEKGVSPLVAHVGGVGHRKIIFDVNTGDVWVKHEPL